MSAPSTPELLVLHGVRVLGFASPAQLEQRYPMVGGLADELLLDFEACGWVRHSSFHDLAGWSLTERGRAEGERRLADELTRTGAREVVRAALVDFDPLNVRLLDAMTRWQLRPRPGDPLAANDHTDWRWDERVLADLAAVHRALVPVEDALAGALDRFGGYAARLRAALDRVEAGERRWVDEPGVLSCHTVWIQLHEDLVATLGVARGRPG